MPPHKPKPLTEQQELLAQNLVMGLATKRALSNAGYDERKRPSILKAPQFLQRMRDLRDRSLKRLDITVDSLIEELEGARVGALMDGQYQAAVQATMGKARMLGLLTDKKEVEHHYINKPAREFTQVIELKPEDWLAEFAPKAIEHKQ